MYACVSIPNIYRATRLRAFADLGGSEVLRSLRHWCFVAIPNLRCGFDKCRSNLQCSTDKMVVVILKQVAYVNAVAPFTVFDKNPHAWARAHETSREPFSSICYSELTNRVGRMLGFDKAWQIVSQQARLHAIRYLLVSGEPVVTRFVTPCSTCFKGSECSICKPQTIFLYKFVECGDMGQGTLVLVVW